MTYALMSDGTVIVKSLFGLQIKRSDLLFFDRIQLERCADCTGTIQFGEAESPYGLTFEHIPDAANVYDLCTKLQHGEIA